MERAAPSDFVRLDDAAREVGCHVETLRLRVRDGRIRALRGPHGVYLVARADLASLERPRRGQLPAGRVSSQKVRDAWVPVESVVASSGRWRERELALANAICREPVTSMATYRLISVHRLRRGAVGFDQIAEELGISARHARRLYHRRVYMALRRLLTRMDKAASARGPSPE